MRGSPAPGKQEEERGEQQRGWGEGNASFSPVTLSKVLQEILPQVYLL